MIAEYKKKVNWYVGSGLLLTLLAGFMQGRVYSGVGTQMEPVLMSGLFIIGEFLLFYGFYCYAKAKGQSGWFSLLGFFNWIGLIILVLLPDKRKQG